MTSQKTKTVDKQAMAKKIVSVAKKRYHESLPKQERPVLETLLFAICLEDASYTQAQKAYERLLAAFHDLNEIRVSSITEVALIFDGLPQPEWRAHRIRTVLHYVFEKHFEFAFEALRRKTLELATKQLLKIRDLSPFVRNYTLHAALGTHVVPVDRSMTNAAIWLGLVPAGETSEHAAESLKSAVRKADVTTFAHMLRCLAVDPKLIRYFERPPAAAPDPRTMTERLSALFKEADSAARKAGKKPAAAVRASARSNGKSPAVAGRSKSGKPASVVRKKK